MTTLETIQALAMQGIGRDGIEATIGHAMDETELTAFHRAKTARRLKRAAEAKAEKKRRAEDAERRAQENLASWMEGTSWNAPLSGGKGDTLRPMSDAERQRKHRNAMREIGALPPPADPWRKMLCRYSLMRFAREYCMERCDRFAQPILKRLPSERMVSFVTALQTTIVFGGNKHVRWPRGKGKTTWIKIAMLWALAYGHKRFIISVGKTRQFAKDAVVEIWDRLRWLPSLAADFPEFSVPMNDVGSSTQSMKFQTCGGVPTRMRQDSLAGYYRLPAIAGMDHTGGIICWRGAGQALRGINIESQRPDFIFLDDPQTDEDARNPETVAKIEDSIQGGVLGVGDIAERVSAVMASTPIEPEDVSERYADPKLHPEWMCETLPLVITWGPAHLRDKYIDLIAADQMAGDAQLTSARTFYRAHRAEIEAGAETMDPGDYSPAKGQVSAYQAALEKLQERKPKRFYSEMQMETSAGEALVVVTPETVRSRQRRELAPFAIPPDSVLVCAAIDCNPSYAFSYALAAFDRRAGAHFPWYGRRKSHLHRERMTEPEYRAAIYEALVALLADIAADAKDKGIELEAVCIDAGGEQTEPVMWLYENRKTLAFPFAIVPMYGRAGKGWRPASRLNVSAPLNETVIRQADDRRRRWMNFNADFWRETMQRGWLATQGAPGALTLFHDPRIDHLDWAAQVTAEKLKSKRERPDGTYEYKWTGGDSYRHDFGDAATMCLAYAGSRGIARAASPLPPAGTAQAARKRRAIVGGRIV